MIVDDDGFNIYSLKLLLGSLNYEVDTAINGEIAIKKTIKKAQNKIQFRIVDCKILVKNENTDAARLACSRIEDSNNPDVLISLSKIYLNNL